MKRKDTLAIYRDRRSKGLCIRCGKPANGKCKCESCLRIQYESKVHNEKVRVRKGLCIECGKVPPLANHRHCTSCLRKAGDTHAKYARNLKVEVLTHYAGGTPSCKCCGEAEIGLLTLDHTEGGGNAERKKTGLIGTRFYLWVKRQGFPARFQVLCLSCNFGRHWNAGLCPAHTQHAFLRFLRGVGLDRVVTIVKDFLAEEVLKRRISFAHLSADQVIEERRRGGTA